MTVAGTVREAPRVARREHASPSCGGVAILPASLLAMIWFPAQIDDLTLRGLVRGLPNRLTHSERRHCSPGVIPSVALCHGFVLWEFLEQLIRLFGSRCLDVTI